MRPIPVPAPLALLLTSAAVLTAAGSTESLARDDSEREPIASRVEVLATGERVLVEEILVAAPLSEVWMAYTTEPG